MSEDAGKVPGTLSVTTQVPGNKGKKDALFYRRARSNVRGVRANTLPDIKPGVPMMRIIPDNKTIRLWAGFHDFEVSDRGRIPKEVREGFEQWMRTNSNGVYTVEVISALIPGEDEPAQYFKVRQGRVVRRLTGDIDMVKRELGDERFTLMTPPPKRVKR